MDRDTYAKQKAFAGEKKASMKRRCVGHDYTRRGVYMLTMVVEGRRPLFGRVYGSSDDAKIELTALGGAVRDCWWDIPHYHPEIAILDLQMMPDHLHGIIFVREQMECDLSRVVRGFKTGCGRKYRELVTGVATVSQQTRGPQPTWEPQPTRGPQQTRGPQPTWEPQPTRGAQQTRGPQPTWEPQPTRGAQHTRGPQPTTGDGKSGLAVAGSHPEHGLLFEPGFNDRILKEDGQLEAWHHYLRDNPRRLLMKREHPDLFRVQHSLLFKGLQFSAIGNRFLLEYPERVQVQCSRRLTEEEIATAVASFVERASEGAVLVSPCISKGEKAVMRAAYEKGFPTIVLQENGFTDLAKPGGKRMEACAEGRLLLLSPWEHHNEQRTITREQCQMLNAMARAICEG